MPNLPANLFWSHPQGDATTVPCVHLVPQHPAGDVNTVPCIHWEVEHPGGDPNPLKGPMGQTLPNVPCTHLRQQHPNGDQVTSPCVHLVQQHPGGDPGPPAPCSHPLPVVREVSDLHLIFYTDNQIIQEEAIIATRRLLELGIKISTTIRPLLFFHREPVHGDPTDATDPFWSHYNPLFHSIQITRPQAPLSRQEIRETLHHEMGHATIGQRLIQIATPGSPHEITKPSNSAEAMSEGWAHFIALVIENDKNVANPSFKGLNWGTRNPSVACRADIEYNVGCLLWDLWDVPIDTLAPRGAGTRPTATDVVNLSLGEMFRIYSPSLESIANGPIISSVGDYLSRLENNNPNLRAAIEQVRTLNCC